LTDRWSRNQKVIQLSLLRHGARYHQLVFLLLEQGRGFEMMMMMIG
jgi:hypothetical protein